MSSFIAFLRGNAPFLAAGALLTFGSSFGQTYFISVFAGEIRGDLDLTHGQWGGIYALGTVMSAAVMVWIGTLTDIYRVRALAWFVMPGLAAACLAMAVVPNGLALIPVIFALRLAGQGMMPHLAITAMARWFVATRGRALSIATLGQAVGQALLPMTFVALMAVFDWRILWVAATVATLAMMPVLMRLLRAERTPQSISKETQTLGMGGRYWTRKQALRHWLLWLSIPMFLGPPAWGTAVFFQQVHLTEVKGWALAEFVALFPLYTLAAVTATVGSGILIDRIGTARTTIFYPWPWALAFVVLSLSDSLLGAALGMMLVGFGTGLQATVPPSYWAQFYGTRHIGSLKALATGLMVLGSALGPGITGWLIDFGIDFPGQMLGIAGYFAVAGVMIGYGVIRAAPLLATAPEVDVIRP